MAVNINIDNIVTDLNNKVDKDLTNSVGALSSSAKEYFGGLGMPSDTYIDLTLGASGTTYTAPANGYLFFEKVSATSAQYVNIQCKNTNGTYLYGYEAGVPASGNYVRMTIPISKGITATIAYNLSGETKHFRFIYAEGSKSEAQ